MFRKSVLQKTITPKRYNIGRVGRAHSFPVYTDYKNGGSKVITIIKKIEGDINALATDLKNTIKSNKMIVKKETMQLFVEGNFASKVKMFFRENCH